MSPSEMEEQAGPLQLRSAASPPQGSPRAHPEPPHSKGAIDSRLWECRECGARELPGVFDAEHEPGCEVGEVLAAVEQNHRETMAIVAEVQAMVSEPQGAADWDARARDLSRKIAERVGVL